MGMGRKAHTFLLNERTPSSSTTVNTSVSARNLRKNDLGGVIFGCKHGTMKECLSKQLFGLPAAHFTYVRNINPGLPLFLFNYSDRKLHGIYEAASTGQMNIDPYGWTDDGSERTAFPAQVRIRIRTECLPLLEKEFCPMISDNFFTASHFWFELDHAQVQNLIAVFRPMPTSGGSISSRSTFMRKNVLPNKWPPLGGVDSTCFRSEHVNTDTSGPKRDLRPSVGCGEGNKCETQFWDDVGNNECGSLSKTSSGSHEDGDLNQQISEWDSPDLYQANLDSMLPIADHSLNGESRTLETHSDKEEAKKDEDEVLFKLKQMVADRERLNVSPKDCLNEIADACAIGEANQDDEQFAGESLDYENILMSISFDPHPDIDQLKEGVEQLKNIALKQLRWTRALENKLVESDLELRQLKVRVRELESSALVPGPPNELSNMPDLDLRHSIFLIGGYNGISWLSALDSYSPSKDILTSLKPMSSTRSYASATTLNGNIYVFGGGDGNPTGTSWYDTVECYNPSNNEWILCPPLIQRKGSLAGATLHGKIFAAGGGNGYQCFSDVEVFDPALGRWINGPSMLQKRFALAAAELNGVLYAVGGYDGKDYLKSAERFDPREALWTRLPNMDTRRGCHSLAVLNGKLYAIGGYEGTKMVSSVEVFDPCAGSWMKGGSLNHSRGYAATAILRDTLYLIGGLKDGENLVDTVETYREGAGWQETSLKAVGRRCFFSAIVV